MRIHSKVQEIDKVTIQILVFTSPLDCGGGDGGGAWYAALKVGLGPLGGGWFLQVGHYWQIKFSKCNKSDKVT